MTSGADRIASSLMVLDLMGEEGSEVVADAMCSETRETSVVAPPRRGDGEERLAKTGFGRADCGVVDLAT